MRKVINYSPGGLNSLRLGSGHAFGNSPVDLLVGGLVSLKRFLTKGGRTMRPFALSIVLFALFAMTGQTAFAQTFSVQGVLRDPLGKTVDDGSYSMTFRLYDQETGGTAIWTETHSGIQVKHGVYAVKLGEVNSLSTVDFSETYWLSMAVNGGAELSPRIKLTHSPYTMSATGADKVFPSAGNVGIGTKTPETALYVAGSDDVKITVNSEAGSASGLALSANNDRKWEIHRDLMDNSLDITETGVGEAVTFQPGGNVGIGTTDPESRLHVSGNVKADGQMRTTGNTSGLEIGDDFFIGGVDATRFGIKAGDQWRVTVTEDGNVGIGTTNPVQPLHIHGNLKLSAADGKVVFTDGSTLSTADLFEGGAAGSLSGYGDVFITADSDSDGVGNIKFNIADSTHMVVTPEGYIGIGTEDPAYNLDVNGDIGFSGDLLENGTPFSSGVWSATYADTTIEHEASVFESFEDYAPNSRVVAIPGWEDSYTHVYVRSGPGAYHGSKCIELGTDSYAILNVNLDTTCTIGYYSLVELWTGYSGHLNFYVDDIWKASTRNYSGQEEYWQHKEVTLPAGTHTLKWQTDNNVRAWVDYIYTTDQTYTGPSAQYMDGKVGIRDSSPDHALTVGGRINADQFLINGKPIDDALQTPWTINGNVLSCEFAVSVGTGVTQDWGIDYYGFGARSANINGVYIGSGWYPYYVTENENWSTFGTSSDIFRKMYVRDVHYDVNAGWSDSRVKQNIRPLQDSLNGILNLRGVRYNVNTDTHPWYKNLENKPELGDRLGFIAQELENVFPQMVVKDESTGFYMIRNYFQLNPVLTEAIKEFKTDHINPLEKEVGELEEELERLLEERK